MRHTVAIVLTLTLAQSALGQGPDRQHSGTIVRSFTEPYQKSVAASPVTGIVVEATVREGQLVRTGDPLAVLNRRVLEATLGIAKARSVSTARLDAAKARFELTQKQLESLKALKADGHSNQYEIEQKQAEYETALADLRAAQDDLDLAALEVKRIQAEIDDRVVRAPIDGYVTEIHKQPGENISNNEPQYATIVSLNKLRVRFYVGADLLKRQVIGNPVVVEVGANRQAVRATVDYVSPVIDSDSGVGRLDVLVDNTGLEIQSGIVAFLNLEASQDLARNNPTAKPRRTARPVQQASRPVQRKIRERSSGKGIGVWTTAGQPGLLMPPSQSRLTPSRGRVVRSNIAGRK